MAKVGAASWDVVCAAPRTYHADYGLARFSPLAGEPCRALGVTAFGTRSPHLFAYGADLRRLLAERWDAVYAWEEPYVVAGAEIAALSSRQSVFAFYTFQNIRKRYPPPFSWLERYTLARADGWVYSGHSVRAVQERTPGYRDRPSALGPLGVDLELFRPDAGARASVLTELGWDDTGPPVIGYVGRFVEEKGLRLLLRALTDLRPAWRALFLGAGPLEPELRRFAAARADRVRIVRAAHDRVPAYMNAIDLLCAPSQTAAHWREQFGRMAIEAFACGVPVVASDSGEIPHVVADAGLVIREDDTAGFGAALAELLESPARRRELRERGLARAHDVYAWPRVARAHLDFIESLRDRRAGSAGGGPRA